MTLEVPLALRVGNRFITSEAETVGFRKEGIGGVKNITAQLKRTLSRFDPELDPFQPVSLFDARTSELLATGRVSDPGRSAGVEGQTWALTAFGPAIHATDQTFPYILIDQPGEQWRRSEYSTKGTSTLQDERGADNPSLVFRAEEGKNYQTSDVWDMIYRGIRDAGMKLARVRWRADSGVIDTDFKMQQVTRTGTGAETVFNSTSANTSDVILAGVVGTDFTNGHDVVSARVVRNGSAIAGSAARWFEFWEFYIRALLLSATGSEITTGYTQNYVLAHEVVNDLLGRVLTEYDGSTAAVSQAGTYQIDQLAYPDGVTAEQVLADVMQLEPALRWYVTGGGQFRWEPLPTTVRYEATLDDGGDFPASTQELWDQVWVRWRMPNGRTRQTLVSGSSPLLTAAGLSRTALLDLGDEIASSTAAARAGTNFLADHAVPKNAGTLNVARRIRDLKTGSMVDPFQVEPGELVRVNGVESYADALNPSGNDGQTVFRIWANEYTSDGNLAKLELDTDTRTTASALAKLAKAHKRKR